MNFTITANAAKRIKELIIKDNDKIALRISVDGGGCSGFMYNYNFVSEINLDDFISEKDGAKVVIDPVSQEFLNQSEIDFIEELGASYFKISNPQATAKCGCGNSFSL